MDRATECCGVSGVLRRPEYDVCAGDVCARQTLTGYFDGAAACMAASMHARRTAFNAGNDRVCDAKSARRRARTYSLLRRDRVQRLHIGFVNSQ